MYYAMLYCIIMCGIIMHILCCIISPFNLIELYARIYCVYNEQVMKVFAEGSAGCRAVDRHHTQPDHRGRGQCAARQRHPPGANINHTHQIST